MEVFTVECLLKNHDENILQQMNKLRKENRYCDVNFIVKGEEFPCHKLVLITASSYFETMFNGNFRESDSHRNITLEDIEPEAFEEILNAVYTGRFNFNCGNAYFILRGSHMLLLMDIFNTIVSRMKSSMRFYDIHYLTETCLFAQEIQHEELFSLCVEKIARRLDILSKIDSFNEKINYDIFMRILKEGLFIDESTIFQVVLRWNEYHRCSEDEILILLDSAELGNTFLSVPLMAKLITNSTKDNTDSIARQNNNTKKSAISSTIQRDDRSNSSENVCHNVYLDVFDVKTGAKGWAILQSKDEFNRCEIIYYQGQCQVSKYTSRTVKKVGNKLYCLENDESYSFSYIEDGKRINLSPLPSNVLNGSYDMEVLDNCLYLVTQSNEDLQLWMYDCLKNNWFAVPIQNFPPESGFTLGKRKYYSRLDDPTPKLTSHDGHLYILVGVRRSAGYYSGIIKVNRRGGEFIQEIIDVPNHYYNKHCSICCYDKKLVMCGGSGHSGNPESTVIEYDMVANAWKFLNNMSIARCDHLLSHHEGFLYAVENKWTFRNEKYDISRKEWTYIPSLPERLYFASGNVTLATGDVFNYTIERL